MALPANHPILKEAFSATYSPSIGGTPVAAYIRAPFRARVGTLSLVSTGAITTADCAIAVAVNGVAVSAMAFTLPVAGAAAGQLVTAVPTTPTYVNENDVISFTPSGASGSTIAGNFGINFIMA